jgi:hypothetical protein
MAEACAWANDFWFDALGQTILRAPKAIANRASRRISERMGMRVVAVEERDFVSGRLPSEIWEITAGEWRAWKKSHPGPSPSRSAAKSRQTAPAPAPPPASKTRSPSRKRG